MKPTESVPAAPAGAPLAAALAQRCAAFLAPFLTALDRQLGRPAMAGGPLYADGQPLLPSGDGGARISGSFFSRMALAVTPSWRATSTVYSASVAPTLRRSAP
jgi:hypothetical protein